MPSGTVIPELYYPDVAMAANWLCRSFGFVERLRIGNHRAQLTYGEGCVVVAELGDGAPVGLGHSVMVGVADVNRHYGHTMRCGATTLRPPADYPCGERQYTAQDIGGHRWTFSQTLADVDPASWGGTLLQPAGGE
jgi:uncharacterized glyoxalase superfamily protein PhnB